MSEVPTPGSTLLANPEGSCSSVFLHGQGDRQNTKLKQRARGAIDLLHQECVKLYPSGLRELIHVPKQAIYWEALERNMESGDISAGVGGSGGA